jgi:hypothetical protein
VEDLLRADWVAEPLTGGSPNEVTAGIWRVRRDGGTAVLKVLTPRRDGAAPHLAASGDPGHWNYWRREELAYSSGLSDALFPELPGPALLDVSARQDGSVGLWLQDVQGRPGPEASCDELSDVARRLVAAPVQSAPWFARDFLRGYTLAQVRPHEQPDWDLPVAAEVWPERLRADLRTLWDRRFDLLNVADRLARTVCHHDVWPMNVVFGADGPVLLDWAFAGPGAIGEDAANLALDTFLDGLKDVALLPDVVEAVRDGYSGALGFDALPAMRVTGAAKYFWLAPRMLLQAPGRARYDARDQAARFAGRAPVLSLIAEWGKAALS